MGTMKVLGTALYQWEIGRKICITPTPGTTVSAVHFAHPGDSEAPTVIPREENGLIVADIPNYLLQSGRSIVAFLVDMDENKVETTCDRIFTVINRPKPADYVYTETEVQTWHSLEERIKNLEENSTGVPSGGGSGITGVEKNLLLALFRNAAYTADMSAKVAELEALWSVSYKVSYNLTGVSASNNAAAVVVGGSYSSTLTAEGGYSLTNAEVTITMGGVDITSTAYSNGVITIASVTGNVDISAVAKEIPSYSVTNNLTGMTNSNSATRVTGGDFYSATLTVINGYELSSVVITMGSVDVTADVYNTDGTILITEVTGDIVITAVAEQPTVIPFITGSGGTTYAYSGGEGTDAKQFVNGNERIALCVRAGATSTYKVRATNNTESDITCDIWYGDLIGANVGLNSNIDVYNAVKAKGSVAIAVGTSITFTATVNGGYYPSIIATKTGLDYEFTGSIPKMSYEDVRELAMRTAVKATLYKADGSDGDTSSTNWSFAPRTADEIMSEDTEVEIIVSNISDALVKGAIQFTQTLGAYTSGEITGYYYTRASDQAYVYPGLDIVAKYTVKAGNALCVNACGTSSDIVVKYRRV